MEKISIRKAKNARSGLIEFINECQRSSLFCSHKLAEIGCYVGDSTEILVKSPSAKLTSSLPVAAIK